MKQSLLDAMNQRILLFDGAMGTEIQKFNPEPKGFPDGKDGFNDGLVLTHPEWIEKLQFGVLESWCGLHRDKLLLAQTSSSWTSMGLATGP